MSRLQELEGLLAFLAPTDIMVVGKQLAARLVPSLCSPHVEVMKESFKIDGELKVHFQSTLH